MQKKIITLYNCRKKYTYDQDKACSPLETVDRFLSRLKEVNLDILKEVRRIDNGRLDIPVYFSVCGRDAKDIIGTKKQMGKGSTPDQARASACMELAERFSFFSFMKNPDNFITGDYRTMRDAGYPVMPCQTLLDSVHDTTHTPELLERLLDDLPLQWTWATGLTSEKNLLVPFSWFFAINEFNGPSAGNTYEEAILQGISEVVERHVCALVTRDKLVTPAINPETVTHPVARDLIRKFQENGIKLYLNDFSLNTGIPTVAAMAYDPQTFPEKSEIVYTAGTTPEADKALIRALTEVAQLAGDFNSGANYVASGLPKPGTLEEIRHITDVERVIDIADMDNLGDADMLSEVENCVSALGRNNMEVFLLDTMHPELQIPAIYTIIPGAHFRERAASGDAALFAAKLAFDLLAPGREREEKLNTLKKLLPDAYYLDFYQGRNLYDIGRIDEALANFDQALHRQPRKEDLPYIFSYKGCCLRDLGRHDEAIEVLEQGRAEDDDRPDIHNILGVCHFKLNHFDEAVTHFSRVVELNPASAIDHANLGINLQRLGKNEEAIASYETALSLDPSIEFAAKGLAELLENM